MADTPLSGGTAEDPVDVWRQAVDDLRDAAARAQWRHPSVLPGWTVADVVAHVSFIERAQLGRQDPAHEPDWDTLPHAVSPFGRITEVPVDLRRAWTRDQVLAEFDETMAAREQALREMWVNNPDQTVRNPLGSLMPLPEVIAMRVFDTWVHEQDIRLAVGDPGHLDPPRGAHGGRPDAPIPGLHLGQESARAERSHVAGRSDRSGPELHRHGHPRRGRQGPPARAGRAAHRRAVDGLPRVRRADLRARPGRVGQAGDGELAVRTMGLFNIAP